MMIAGNGENMNIIGVVLQTNLVTLENVQKHLEGIPGCSIFKKDKLGRIIVTVEESASKGEAEILIELRSIPLVKNAEVSFISASEPLQTITKDKSSRIVSADS
jgi:nitrate reductase NapAB chaperone NapD